MLVLSSYNSESFNVVARRVHVKSVLDDSHSSDPVFHRRPLALLSLLRNLTITGSTTYGQNILPVIILIKNRSLWSSSSLAFKTVAWFSHLS